MNAESGEMKEYDRLTEAEKKSGKWLEVPKKYLKKFEGMNRAERRKYVTHKKGKWGWR